MSPRAWLAALALSWLVPAPAEAWPHEGEAVHEGLIYRRLEGPLALPGAGVSWQAIHVLYVDTWQGEVSLVASRPDDRRLRVSEFAERHGLAAAINANYFDRERAPCGLTAGGGELWLDAYHHLPWGRCADSVGFDGVNEVTFFDSFERLTGPLPPGVTEVVTGMPTLVRGGQVVDAAELRRRDYPPNLRSPNPRTAIGLHEDGRTLVLVVVEGRGPGRRGLTGLGLARLMRQVLGCREAVAMDGGGSSAMFVRGQPPSEPEGPAGLVSRTGPRGERGVCCHLGVRLTPGAAMWRAELVERSPDPEVVSGETFTLWARYRNAGRRRWLTEGGRSVSLIVDDGPSPSPFYLEESWPSLTEAALLEEVTGAGETALFRLRAIAALEPGLHTLTLRPEVDGVELRAPPVSWQITVEPSPPPGPACSARGDRLRDTGTGTLTDARPIDALSP